MSEFGYAGKILVVDLTTSTVDTIDTVKYEKFIGGRAMTAAMYWDYVTPECGALDPENALCFATGPSCGTLSPGGSRTSISTKSPCVFPHDAYTTSTTGGSTGAELKFAGFDGLIVKGKAEKPVYLHITDGKCEILSAVGLWGLTIRELDRQIKQTWGIETRMFAIGPSGEHLSKYAAIINDFSHATGQGGFGCVMGSKNLKCIAIHGTGSVKVANPKALLDAFWTDVYNEGPNFSSAIPAGTMTKKPHSLWPLTEEETAKVTSVLVTPTNTQDYFDYLNTLPAANNMISEDINKGKAIVKFGGCYSCPGPCHFSAKYLDGNIPSISMNLCHQPSEFRAQEEKVYQQNWSRYTYLFDVLCIDYGMSVDVMGLEHEWFNDLYKAGYITNEMMDLGEDFDYKDPEAVLNEEIVRKIVHKIAYREGELWSLCADGPDIAMRHFAAIDDKAKSICRKYMTKPYFISMDGTGYAQSGQPMSTLIMGLGYKYMHHSPYQHYRNGNSNTTKGVTAEQKTTAMKNARDYWGEELFGEKDWDDYEKTDKSYVGKGEGWKFFFDMEIEMDSMCYCGWAGFPFWQSRNKEENNWVANAGIGAEIYNAIFGTNRTFKENVAAFAPATCLMRAIHVREGRTKEHDCAIDETLWTAKDKWGSREMWTKGVEECYSAAGWDPETGIPLAATFKQYGLDDVAADLKARGFNVK